jgi:hypothetical protein
MSGELPHTMTIAEKVKQAATAVGEEFPGSHVICVAVHDGVISLFAKSDAINDQLEACAALDWVVKETAAQAARAARKALSKPSRRAQPPDRKAP